MASAKKYDAIIIWAGQSGGTVDLGKVRQRKRDIFDMYCRGCRGHIEDSAWVDLLMGQACFVDRKIVEVQLNESRTKQLSTCPLSTSYL